MKIVCDSCSTKYSISDDKVRGKVFKIRCKKCSHIIVVRGTADGAAAAAPEAPTEAVWHIVVEGEQAGPLTDAEVRARLARGEITGENYIWKEGFADWLKLSAVADFADAAPQPSTSGELYSNANGNGLSAPEAAAAAGSDANADFFGGGVAGQEARAMAGGGGYAPAAAASSRSGRARATGAALAAAPAAAPAAEEDAFSSPPTPGGMPMGGGADLFGAASQAGVAPEPARVRGTNGTAGRHDGGRLESLTAQRSENSVLFSLSNLQSLAAPSAAPAKAAASSSSPSSAASGGAPNTEGSGLIDIRAMAASTLKSPAFPGGPPVPGGIESGAREDDLPVFGAFSSAQPVLLPMSSSSGPPKWLYALIGAAVLMILALAAIAVSILRKPVVAEAPPPAPVAVPAAAAPAAGKPAEAKAPEAPASKPMAEADLPPREGGAAAGEAGDRGDKGTKSGKRGKPGKKGAPGDKAAGGAAVAAAPSGGSAPTASAEPDVGKPTKGSLDDLLDRALNKKGEPRAKSDDSGGARKSDKGGDRGASAEPAGNGPLAKGAVVAGMNGVKGKISECYSQYKVPGLAMVKVIIGKNGKVSSATVSGKFAGTPSGACVEKAVRSASFPPSDGLTTDYPFTLR